MNFSDLEPAPAPIRAQMRAGHKPGGCASKATLTTGYSPSSSGRGQQPVNPIDQFHQKYDEDSSLSSGAEKEIVLADKEVRF
ncbi:MAG TPA: hypothetical protein PLL06_09830 [Acidobacteriota bacterium]|nr:hypothetical protein [Acidobacteriota bacterium]HMZ79988.1 hypothetical protein [Acidobacteriota bacterium]